MSANALPLLQILGLLAVIAALFGSPLPWWLALLIAGLLVTAVATWLEMQAPPKPAVVGK